MRSFAELLAGHCPEGVEFKTLGEVGTFTRGSGLPKTDFADEGVPCIHYGQIYTHYRTSTTATRSFVSEEVAKRLKKATTGDLVVTTTSENVDDVCKAVAWLGEGEVAIGGHSCVYSHDLDPLFVAYYLQSRGFQAQKRKHVSGTKVKDIKISDLARVKIPVPPAAVQREIADILGKMEMLKSELEAELELRSRQLDFYRDDLLTSATETDWVRVGDYASLRYGYTAKASDAGEYRFLRITDIDRNGKLMPNNAKFVAKSDDADSYLVKAGDLLMARTGATYGKTMLASADMNAVYASFLIRLRFDPTKVLPAFYWHFAQSGHFWRQAHALVSSGGQPQFNGNVLKEVEFPLPTLSEQMRIVDVLDKFDALVNDLSIGLPAEIAARRKQYEYYRDKLLTFPEKAAEEGAA